VPKLRTVRRAVIVVIVLCSLVAAAMYLLSSGIPAAYRPAQLPVEERRRTASRFVNHVLRFGNDAQDNAPYTWSVTEQQLNEYVGSLEEIADTRPGPSRQEVSRAMERAGLAEPAIILGDGMITVMVRTTKYNKILAADVSLTFTPERKLSLRLEGVRVGYLPVPKKQVHGLLSRLREKVDISDSKGDSGEESGATDLLGPGVASERVGKLLGVMFSAIDGEPIETELVWPINKRYVRIDGIDIADKTVTLHVTPTRRKKSKR
jgi:hypothetical protein